MAKLRAVIVADIEVKSLQKAFDYEKKLQELALEIEKWGPPDATLDEDEPIAVEKVLAKITLQERRGSTGDLEQIVFRGSRS